MSALIMTLGQVRMRVWKHHCLFLHCRNALKNSCLLSESLFLTHGGLLMRYRRHMDALLNVCNQLCFSQSVDINSPSQFAKIHLPIC